MPENNIQKKHLGRQAGFTIIELLTVAVIISIMSVFVLASSRTNQKRYVLEQAAQQLVSDIRRAQNMAMSGVEITGLCDLANPCNGYGAYVRVDTDYYVIYGNKNNNRRYQPASDVALETIDLPSNVEIQSIAGNQIHICFEPPDPITYINNNDSPGISGTITLGVEDTSFSKTITITTAGLIQVQ